MDNPTKQCCRCKKILPRTSKYYYYRNKKRKWFCSWCIKCKNEYRYRKDNWSKELEKQRERRKITHLTDKQIESKRKYDRRYRKNHPGGHNHDTAMRRAALYQRTPIWADLNEIKKIYKNCPKGYQVDHIIPLRGKNVSGLHVPENLQYLLASENGKKSNHFSIQYGGIK